MKKEKEKRRELRGKGSDTEATANKSASEKNASSEEDEDSDDDKESVKEVIRPRRKPTRGRVRCKDGFAMSVQASRDHACTPRDDSGPYAAVEVGYPNQRELLLMPFAGDSLQLKYRDYVPMIYNNVPSKTLRAVVSKHNGLRSDSARLSELLELDEDGYQWAAAAEPPTTEEEEDSTPSAMGSPSSAMHMGAPPPPPPPMTETETPTLNETTMNDLSEAVLHVDARDVFEAPSEEEMQRLQRLGAMTPPTPLTNATLSPIEKTQDFE